MVVQVVKDKSLLNIHLRNVVFRRREKRKISLMCLKTQGEHKSDPNLNLEKLNLRC